MSKVDDREIFWAEGKPIFTSTFTPIFVKIFRDRHKFVFLFEKKSLA